VDRLRYHPFDGGRLGLLELKRGSSSAIRLLCLPHSGGNPIAFQKLAATLAIDATVAAVDYPGHVRSTGAPLRTIDAIAATCMRLLPDEFLAGAVLLGHSVGGYVAHAMTLGLERAGRAPRAVVISAVRPPPPIRSGATNAQPISKLDDDRLFEWIVRTSGGFAPEREMFMHFQEAIRADLEAYETYDPPATPLLTSALFVGGLGDPLCSSTLFAEWLGLAVDASLTYLPGGHFGLYAHPEDAAGAIEDVILRTRAQPFEDTWRSGERRGTNGPVNG
jgi:surfactin synthase thioesterase subunit